MVWYVYIVETKNKALYTGITNNLQRRINMHQSGKGARFTRIFGFHKLVYWEQQKNRISAMKREAQIKRWSRSQKIELCRAFPENSALP